MPQSVQRQRVSVVGWGTVIVAVLGVTRCRYCFCRDHAVACAGVVATTWRHRDRVAVRPCRLTPQPYGLPGRPWAAPGTGEAVCVVCAGYAMI
ncbi:hypothetical protein GCM10010295_38460 [Streptomyces intermedius]